MYSPTQKCKMSLMSGYCIHGGEIKGRGEMKGRKGRGLKIREEGKMRSKTLKDCAHRMYCTCMQYLHCLWNPGKLLDISTAFGEAQNRKAGHDPLQFIRKFNFITYVW